MRAHRSRHLALRAAALAVTLPLIGLDSPASQGVNQPPAAPAITEPSVDGQVVNPADVHMETGPFSDPDPLDQHFCTDWEIWTLSPAARVWSIACATGLDRVHVHLGDGTFEGSHSGRSELFANTDFRLRARHSDDSGDPATQWSPWTERTFHTGDPTQVFALEIEDVLAAPAPRWVAASGGADVILAPASPPPSLALETGAGALLLAIEANDGASNTVTNPAALAVHEPVRVVLRGGALGLTLAETNLVVLDEHCASHAILLPAVSLPAGASAHFWISVAGASYAGDASQTAPSFATLARGLTPPWDARQTGFQVEIFASGFRLPVNIAFVPRPAPAPGDPFFYVTELRGTIKTVARDGTVSDFATGLLNYNPSLAFPGSGEQGLAGIAVDPATGDVFASMLYASAANPSLHYPKVDRFTSTDGGRTAATRVTILDMPGELQGQSHQISNLTIAPDGRLLCHMGDGFDAATAKNLNSFRGKILRLELDGAPAQDNPFYDPSDGITSRDYVFAYGVRNPFGGDWRFADGRQYIVENGPSVDRFGRVLPGRNFRWNGSDQSMTHFALYNWVPAHGPVNLAFVQPETFGGSGFPARSMGHAFVTESGPTYATGPQALGKRITEWIFDPTTGALVAGPIPFLEYAGIGKATACGLEAGPDGLYMTELYNDVGGGATSVGARVLRIYYDASGDCNGNGIDDGCDIAGGASADANGNLIPDECECAGIRFCSALPNSTGWPARISSNGACSVADNALVLTCASVPDQAGRFFYGTNQVNGGAGVPFYDGLRCVGAGMVNRLPLVAPANGVATFAVDFGSVPAGGAITPGATWHFQYWFRDSAAGASGSNLSDALSITFE